MSEYWKSTPKYWCKHCGIYVRDTKLERTNHESTGKHQGALKRFLRDLHRNHEQEGREKERAKREIERLNGLVPSSSSSTAGPSSSRPTETAPPQSRNDGGGNISREQRQKQWEQLVELGIEVPDELRGEMAMVGEWTVTNTRVVNDGDNSIPGEGGEQKATDAIATGVRKRSQREIEDEGAAAEEEAAIKGLFKKPRKWGRDTRQAPEDDAELNALLSGTLVVPPPKKGEGEEGEEKKIKLELAAPVTVKKEVEGEELPNIKKEESGEEGQALQDIASKPDAAAGEGEKAPAIKKEEGGETAVEAEAVPAVIFKKRKPKNIRQK